MPKLKLGGNNPPDKTKKMSLRDKVKAISLLPEEKYRSIDFISSGSSTLNLALTDNINYAYPIGRMVNIVGDYSTGKTLAACEVVNALWYIYHLQKGKKIKIYYDEPEDAFDMDLAKKFNMPLEHIYGLREKLPGHVKDGADFCASRTVEDFYNSVTTITRESKNYDCVLYVLDSMDSLSDARELNHIEKKGIEKQDFKGGKAAVLSQLFRTTIQDINGSNILLIIISQIRDKMNAGPFEKKHTRAGGHALDFYASQIIWLLERGKLKAKNGLVNGIDVNAYVDKNKVGDRYRTANFQILHGHGIDDLSSLVEFIWDNGGITKAGAYLKYNGENYTRDALIQLADNDINVVNDLKCIVQNRWSKMVLEAKPQRNNKWG